MNYDPEMFADVAECNTVLHNASPDQDTDAVSTRKRTPTHGMAFAIERAQIEALGLYHRLKRRLTAMATNANEQRHFDRTIRALEVKLGRQEAAVADTKEMIEAVKALKEKESGASQTQTSGTRQRT